MTAPLILLTAGGTGGHLFPAEALANALKGAGARVVLVTDRRANAYAGSFPAEEIVAIPSATPSGRSVLERVRAGLVLAQGTIKALLLIRRLRPAAVVGFGGYPTVPPVLAAALLGVPAVIHEANGVLGRANRLLSRWSSLIATGFPSTKGIPPARLGAILHTGNPIRPLVRQAMSTPYPPLSPEGPVRLLVFGGSQGARIMSEVVPEAVRLLPRNVSARMILCQQAREEDCARVRKTYADLGIACEIEPFYKDMPRRIAEAHLVISRSGASTVAELSAIGRPSILVPLPGSLDQDQAANAASLGQVGAAIVLPQSHFTPERLAHEIQDLLSQPDRLTCAAAAAKSIGTTDAAERLAQAVLKLASPSKNGIKS